MDGKLSIAQAEKLTGITRKQVERMKNKLKDPEKYRRELLGAEYLAAQLAEPDHFRTNFSGNNEWHTPVEYIEMARKVLGQIDLDPASSVKAQKTVQAGEFYKFTSEAINGLTLPWHGRVWLNPPYAPQAIAAFVARMCEEYESKHVSAAIMLTHNYTDSAWFQKAAKIASALCFPETRIRFQDPDGVPCSPTQGQAFFYFGTNPVKFIAEFKSIGLIVRPVK